MDIFFSYAHLDRERVRPLVARLQKEGWSVWWDREIVPGKPYEQLIDEAIREARCVVVAWSEASLDSSWVHNEALEGLERGILVPLMLEDVRVPVAFRQTQAAQLDRWPDEFDPEELDNLLRGIREVLADVARGDAVRESASQQPAPVPAPDPAPRRESDSSGVGRRRWPMVLAGFAAVAGIVGGIGWNIDRERQASEHANDLTTLRQLVDDQRHADAFALAERIAAARGEDAIEPTLWETFSSEFEADSVPQGATVSVQPYDAPELPWRTVGVTPVAGVRLADGAYRLRFELDGYSPVIHTRRTNRPPSITSILERFIGRSLPLPVDMQPLDRVPENMVFVPGGVFPLTMTGYRPGMVMDMSPFFISRFEVTNAEYQRFVSGDGYTNPEYCQSLEFDDGGATLTLEQALANFTDSTGRPGPAGWQFGRFPEGRADHPVTGISWYEAMAYARYAGVELPTAFHWNRAAIGLWPDVQPFLIASSNFSGTLSPVGAYAGVTQFGLRDAAGNAGEWVQNETTGMRAVMGGSAADPKYMMVHTGARPPLTRAPLLGFRTMRRVDPDLAEPQLAVPIVTNSGLKADFHSVSDETYAVLQTQFGYQPMIAETATTDIAPAHPRRVYERVELTYADGTQIPVYVIRPREHDGRLQPIVFFPGQTEFQYVKDSTASVLELDFLIPRLVDSGRAVVWPIYHGSNATGMRLSSGAKKSAGSSTIWRRGTTSTRQSWPISVPATVPARRPLR